MFGLLNGNKKEKEKEVEKARLIRLKNKVEALQEMPHDKRGFTYVLDFFNIIAYFQDEGKVSYAKNASLINGVIDVLGRKPYGWNRTKKYEKVTLDNFYVGSQYGLFTKTLRTWMDSTSVYPDFAARWHPNLALLTKNNPFDWQVVLFFIIEPFIKERKKLLLYLLKKGIATL